MSLHTIRLKASFTGPRRNRAGHSFLPGTPQTLELNKEELEAFKADPEFIIEKPAKASVKAAPAPVEEVAEEIPAEESAEEAPVEEVEASK